MKNPNCLSLAVLWLAVVSATDDRLDLKGADDLALKNLGGRTDVTAIDLRRAKLTEDGMKVLKTLPGLWYLNMHFVDIGDQELAHLKAVSKLSELHLGPARKITDAGLKHLGAILTLETLHVDGASVSDAGLAHLKTLTNLQDLHLSDNAISDAGLEHLEVLKKLKSLHIFNTNVTAAGIAKLKKALPDCDIWGPD